MKKTLLLSIALLLAALSTSSCMAASLKDRATAYNKEIMDLKLKVVTSLFNFEGTYSSFDGAMMTKALNEALETTKKAVKDAKAMGPFDGDTRLRDAAIELFEFYVAVGKRERREVVTILSRKAAEEKDVNRIEEIAQSITARDKALLMKFNEIQAEFAKKYDVDSDENKPQK
ncbi:hypothetical protein ACFL2F_03825 [Myxococcota bacterium]